MTDNRTTELREKLTERGINYVADIASHDGVRTTHWKNDCNTVFQAIDFGMDDLLIQVVLTPEQAIAATLGSGTLTAEQVREAIEANAYPETSTTFEFESSSWQAIADELNVELGSGTCENLGYPMSFTCSECGCEVSGGDELDHNSNMGEFKFCPNCGKAVER